MNRETFLVTLIPALCGCLVLAWAFLWGSAPNRRTSAGANEGVCWRRLWTPLAPGVLAISVLIGWALQEPDRSDESLRPVVFLVAAVFAFIWARAGARAVRSLVDKPTDVPAATLGFLRPRVVITPPLTRALDPAALRAVEAHEAAHVRHRDPLRIWLAHLAADLQWPWPYAQRLLRAWRQALEHARDDEARACGIDGADLASAILVAARLGRCSKRRLAALTEDGVLLQERVQRLLCPDTVTPPTVVPAPWLWIVLVSLAIGVALGFVDGDTIVRMLPGVIS